ncbi:hypothetical protein [Nocardia pseudovaccinii]|uniref:hypothetical protein n=1 Tax=Nocardia pseudovaccinii TaxID=189540 RepID=UPI0007A43C9E|nr:hypothetical protein [Nocardia pseudovaccinii]
MTGPEQRWWSWTAARPRLLLAFGLIALTATTIGVVDATRTAGDRSAYEREDHALNPARVTDAVVHGGVTRSATYRLEVDTGIERHLDFPSGNTILAAVTPGSAVELEIWRDQVVAVRWNDIRAETVDAPTADFGTAIGASLIGFGCALLGFGGWLVERNRRAWRPRVEAALVAALCEGFVMIVAGWLLLRDPLRENLLARHMPLTLVAGTVLACGIATLTHRHNAPRHAQLA